MTDQNNQPDNGNSGSQWGPQGENPYGQTGQPSQPGQPAQNPAGPFQPAQQPAQPQQPMQPQQPAPPQQPMQQYAADPYAPHGAAGVPPMPAPPAPGGSRNKMFGLALAGLMALAAAVGLGWWLGGNNDDTNTATGDPGSTEMGEPLDRQGVEGMEIPRPGELSTSLQDIPQSVVRIVVAGENVTLEGVAIDAFSSGSGAIISEDGVAVTNSHVVAGASLIEVYVPGETQPRSARVLGTSLCSDLAVIDIEGEGFTPLSFTMDPVTLGTTVYSAGYPLGDPEFTLTKGIISKENADGRGRLSAVRSVLEHDARINGGNSGGPLLNESGQIVGINYQLLNSAAPQFLAISAPDAFNIIDALAGGNDVDSIGINGQIVQLETGFGMFVSAIETGGIAERAGIRAGDVILEIERIPASNDGSMAIFCDTLRTQGSDALLDVAVLRPSTGEVFRGQLNDDAPLAVAFSATEVMEDTDLEGEMAPVATSDEFIRISDDTGSVTAEVPASWAQIDARSLSVSDGQITVPAISASPDLESFRQTFNAPGVELLAVPGDEISFDGLWSAFDNLTTSCSDVGEVTEGAIGNSTGAQQVASGCGSSGAALFMLQVHDTESDYFLRVTLQLVTNEDIAAAERIIATANLSV